MNHDCIRKMSAKLAEINTGLVYTLSFARQSEDAVVLRTYQILAGRGKPKAANVVAAYCPFCGRKYKAVKAAKTGARR